MKIFWIVFGLCLCQSTASPKASADPNPDIPPPPPSIQLTPEAEILLKQLLEVAGQEDGALDKGLDDAERTRRTSGHFDKHKFSLGSISSYDHYHDKHLDFHTKAFNLWGFKKAILASLVQAIKAVTGGVIALKGAVIKGTGHIVEGTGKILEHKGEAIKDFGKHVVTKALSKPIHVPVSPVYHHGHDHGYPIYGAPAYSQPGYGSIDPYGPQEHHHFYHHDQPSYYHSKSGSEHTAPGKHDNNLPNGIHAGLVVLKPLLDNSYNSHSSIYGDHIGGYSESNPSISRSIEYSIGDANSPSSANVQIQYHK